jgi:hypothetical protein
VNTGVRTVVAFAWLRDSLPGQARVARVLDSHSGSTLAWRVTARDANRRRVEHQLASLRAMGLARCPPHICALLMICARQSHRRRNARNSLQRPLQRSECGIALRSGLAPIRLRSTEPKVSGSNPDGRVEKPRKSGPFLVLRDGCQTARTPPGPRGSGSEGSPQRSNSAIAAAMQRLKRALPLPLTWRRSSTVNPARAPSASSGSSFDEPRYIRPIGTVVASVPPDRLRSGA